MSRISDKAVLVKLSTRQWSGTKKDREASARVTQEAHAASTSGAFYKRLAHSHLFGEFSRVAQAARQYHMQVTLPWMDGGYRLLPTDMFFEYQQNMAKYKDEARDIAASIREEFPRILRQAEVQLGSLYKPEDFPTPEKVEQSFGLDVAMIPVPEVADFRLEVDDQTEQEIRDAVVQSYKDQERQAMMDLWQRLHDNVEHLATRLHEVDAAERKRLHESVVGHLRDLVEILPSLNITRDQELDGLAQEAKDKLLVDINRLRSNPEARQETTKAADDLLSRITGAMQQR